MIRYGHNDIDHAAQLIYLLRREGFDPKVQLTPKSSAFLYLDEWGEADYPVTTLKSGKKWRSPVNIISTRNFRQLKSVTAFRA